MIYVSHAPDPRGAPRVAGPAHRGGAWCPETPAPKAAWEMLGRT